MLAPLWHGHPRPSLWDTALGNVSNLFLASCQQFLCVPTREQPQHRVAVSRETEAEMEGLGVKPNPSSLALSSPMSHPKPELNSEFGLMVSWARGAFHWAGRMCCHVKLWQETLLGLLQGRTRPGVSKEHQSSAQGVSRGSGRAYKTWRGKSLVLYAISLMSEHNFALISQNHSGWKRPLRSSQCLSLVLEHVVGCLSVVLYVRYYVRA